ncbi:MAG: hypothetical protein DRO00_08015 [Thermoproteota archaeon]|nr:MAG: hypothetical protein DRO00_08015 [Candidatus Korarchaeota archaeon]
MKYSKLLREILSLLFMALALVFVLRRVDPYQLLTCVGEIRPMDLVLTSFMSILAVLSSTFRWYLLLSSLRKIPLKRVLSAVLSGYYLLLILPYGAGHIAKVGLIGGDYYDAVGSLMLGMMIETLLFVLLLAPALHNKHLLGAIAISIIFSAAIIKKIDKNISGVERLEILCKRIPIVGNLLLTLEKDLEIVKDDLKRPSLLILLSFLSLLAQLCGIWILVRSLDYNAEISDLAIAFASSIFVGFIGGTPGGVGGNELGLAIGLERAGIPLESSLSIALVFKTLFQYVYAPVGGIIFHLKMGSQG